MAIIKRKKDASTADLAKAVEELIPLLLAQKEKEAVEALELAVTILKDSQVSSEEHKAAVAAIIEAFEGDHELMAYTFQREGGQGQWTEAEVLSQASARVISLARRMQ
jgi:hypothetical protein